MLMLLISASCSNLPENGGPPLGYVVFADTGPVLVEADGVAHGFTQSALEAAVRKGHGSNQGNTQNEKSPYYQRSIDFRYYLGVALFEPRPVL